MNAPELLAKVYAGVRYEDGIEVTRKEVAARAFTHLLTESPSLGTCRPPALSALD